MWIEIVVFVHFCMKEQYRYLYLLAPLFLMYYQDCKYYLLSDQRNHAHEQNLHYSQNEQPVYQSYYIALMNPLILVEEK
jgi:hypothetical protein